MFARSDREFASGLGQPIFWVVDSYVSRSRKPRAFIKAEICVSPFFSNAIDPENSLTDTIQIWNTARGLWLAPAADKTSSKPRSKLAMALPWRDAVQRLQCPMTLAHKRPPRQGLSGQLQMRLAVI